MRFVGISSIIIYLTFTGCDKKIDNNSNITHEDYYNYDSIMSLIDNERTNSADTFNIDKLIKDLQKRDSIIYQSVDFDSTFDLIDHVWINLHGKLLEKENRELEKEYLRIQKDLDEMEDLIKKMQESDSILIQKIQVGDSLKYEKRE